MIHHKHDCDNCSYLGETIGGGKMFDLYHCTSRASGSVTLIARYGEDGDYYSSPINYIRPDGHAELFVALAMYGGR